MHPHILKLRWKLVIGGMSSRNGDNMMKESEELNSVHLHPLFLPPLEEWGNLLLLFINALLPVYLTIVTNLTRVFLTGSVVDYPFLYYDQQCSVWEEQDLPAIDQYSLRPLPSNLLLLRGGYRWTNLICIVLLISLPLFCYAFLYDLFWCHWMTCIWK